MFLKIAGFEFLYQLRNPILWIAVTLFGALVFYITIGPNSLGEGPGIHKNTHFKVGQLYLMLSVLYMFVSAAFVANAVVRDDETRFGPMMRSKPITKFEYLFGRYAGAFCVTALAFLIIPAALFIGTLMPGLDPTKFEPNHLSAYLMPYLCLALPDLFVTSALFFAFATMTRSMMATYVSGIALLMFWIGTIAATVNGHGELAGYIDPFGRAAIAQITRYWTPDELTRLGTPFYGIVLWNRIIWIALAAAVLTFAHARFRFGERIPRSARRRSVEAETPAAIEITGLPVPRTEPRFDRATAWAQLRVRTRLDMAQIFRSPAYFVLLALGLIFSVSGTHDLSPTRGTPSLPVTRLMVQLLNENFDTIPLIIAIYYCSELVWREHDRNIHEIVGASAIPDWAYVVPKIFAVALVLISTLLVSMVGAVGIQLFHGYTQFEIGKYLLWYLLPNATDYVLIAILAVFVQTVSPHKFAGWGIMLLYVISRSQLSKLGLEDHLYTYAQGPAVPLSDMNGQGRFWVGAWSFRAYWTAFAILLLVLSHALWRRGAETRLAIRLKRLPRRLNGTAGGVAALGLLAFAGLGTWCFINTHVWNVYRTSRGDDRYSSEYEKQLLRYEKLLQPSVTMVRVKADLWPHQQKLVTSGTLDLVNRQAVPLFEIHLRMRSPETRWTNLSVSGASLARDYPRFQYRIYRFAKPLAPGAVARIAFTTVHQQIGFRNERNDTRVVDNGTLIQNRDLMPLIGMDRADMLTDPDARRRNGLPAELHPAKLEDLAATRFNMFHGDWVKTDITLTTDADQTPIAPGAKISDAIKGGRCTARFVSEAPIQNYFSIQSAHYLERHVRHDGVDLAVYYDAQHPRNVDRMLAASAQALDTYRSTFGLYQFSHMRIVEFPVYMTAAISFAGTFPYSEGFGFIADLFDPGRIDYTRQVVAHELAHQYWGNQANPADMQGKGMLTETLAQYSALLVMEKVAGRDEARRYRLQELDKYLFLRGFAQAREMPLARVEQQDHVAYQKGQMAFARLRDVLGAERVNAALRRYLERFRFRPAPWPRSLDLIAEFRKGASPAENQLITDLFEKITLYDVRTKAASIRKLPDGRYETTLTVEARKFYADGKGSEIEAALAEPIGFGVFTAMPGWGPFDAKAVLALRSVPIHGGVQHIKFITAARPRFAGIDPYHVLIDRNSDDNVIATTG